MVSEAITPHEAALAQVKLLGGNPDTLDTPWAEKVYTGTRMALTAHAAVVALGGVARAENIASLVAPYFDPKDPALSIANITAVEAEGGLHGKVVDQPAEGTIQQILARTVEDIRNRITEQGGRS